MVEQGRSDDEHDCARKRTRDSPICIPLRSNFVTTFVAGWLGERTMSAQSRIGTIAFAFGLPMLGLAISVPANTTFAGDCLTAPSSSATPNSHWYYRTDRTQQRKCWYVRAVNDSSDQRAAQVARGTPSTQSSQPISRTAPSLANFKVFVAQNGGAKLSDEEVQELYAEFLEWNRRAKN